MLHVSLGWGDAMDQGVRPNKRKVLPLAGGEPCTCRRALDSSMAGPHDGSDSHVNLDIAGLLHSKHKRRALLSAERSRSEAGWVARPLRTTVESSGGLQSSKGGAARSCLLQRIVRLGDNIYKHGHGSHYQATNEERGLSSGRVGSRVRHVVIAEIVSQRVADRGRTTNVVRRVRSQPGMITGLRTAMRRIAVRANRRLTPPSVAAQEMAIRDSLIPCSPNAAGNLRAGPARALRSLQGPCRDGPTG